MKLLDQVKDVVTGATVFGAPYEKNGVTVIPASRVLGGGGGGQAPDSEAGGGGVGVGASPAGAFVVNGSDVRWVPAFDLNRAIFMSQLVAIFALLTLRTIVRASRVMKEGVT